MNQRAACFACCLASAHAAAQYQRCFLKAGNFFHDPVYGKRLTAVGHMVADEYKPAFSLKLFFNNTPSRMFTVYPADNFVLRLCSINTI